MASRPLLLYQASAGAGKTYTLVREFLRLALQFPDGWERILAVTFTRKATAELQERVVRQLAALANAEAGTAPLAAELHAGIEQDLYARHGSAGAKDVDVQRAAQILLEKLLHDFDALGIQTLDAFFLRIVKAFFFEVSRQTPQAQRIQAGFEVELDGEAALAWAIAQVMDSVGGDPILTKWLEQRVATKLDNEEGWDLTRELESLSRHLLRASTGDPFAQHLPDDKELQKGLDHLGSHSNALVDAVAVKAKVCLAAFQAAGVTPSDFKVGNAKIGNAIELATDGAFKHFTDAQLRYGGVPSSLLSYKPPHEERDQALSGAGLVTAYGELVAAVKKARAHVPPIRYIQTNASLLPVLLYLRAALQAYRLERQVLLMQDVQQLLEVIVAETPVPFLYEKVGTRYRHYFLDEFQDTSRQQWHNLRPLIDNALAENARSLIVGDVKQAIYRWRGGDQALLPEVAETYHGRVEERVLEHNYRSGGQLIQFVNQFFDAAVEVLAANLPDDSAADVQTAFSALTRHQALPNHLSNRADLGYVEIRATKATADEWVADFFVPLWAELEQQGFALDDIAILVRTNSVGKRYGAALVAAGFPVVSADALVLSASAAVQHVMSAVQWLLSPTDAIAAAHLRIAANGTATHDRLTHTSPIPAALQAEAASLRRRSLEQGLPALCRLLGYTPATDPYLLRLLALGQEVGQQQGGWAGFLRVFEQQADRLSVAAERTAGSLSLLTIHKAKGLEFPVVVLPEADWSFRPKSDGEPLWAKGTTPPFDALTFPLPVEPVSSPVPESPFYAQQLEEAGKTLLDELNTLYVALTRAVDRLYIFAPFVQAIEPTKAVNHLLQTLVATGGPLAAGFDPETERFAFGDARSQRIAARLNAVPTAQPLQEGPLRLSEPGQAIRRQAERFSSWSDPSTESAARLRGQRIHALMAAIHTAADLPRAIEAACQEGWLSREAADALQASLLDVLTHPELAAAFDPTALQLTERPVLVPGGTLLRPDRITLHADTTWVVEFKTGAPAPDHAAQLQGYLEALLAAGLPAPTGRLVYLEPLRVQVVS